MTSYYDLLGIAVDASYDEVKRAWRQKAQQWHPDKFSSADEKLEAHARFVEIMEAYMVLINAQKRASYDHWTASAGSDPWYSGYENVSPEQDQQEAADLYGEILRETPLVFASTTVFSFLVFIFMFPILLLGDIALLKLALGKEGRGFSVLHRLVYDSLLFNTLTVGLFELAFIFLIGCDLLRRFRRMIQLAKLMARGRRIMSGALVARSARS